MSASKIGVRPSARWVLASFTIAAGISIGWFLKPIDARTFDLAYPIISSIGSAVLGVSLLVDKVAHARWAVPLLLGMFMTTVSVKPHVVALSTVGIAAGVIASFAALFDRKAVAIVGTLLCCASIGASLFIGLTRG
jgi:hypothetical protein